MAVQWYSVLESIHPSIHQSTTTVSTDARIHTTNQQGFLSIF